MLYKYDNLQAFRSDRWKNFVRQPAQVGPVLFTQTSSAYLDLEPVSGGASSGGTNAIIVIVLALVVAGAVVIVMRSRRKKSADDRA